MAGVVEYLHVVAGHRDGRRAMLHRQGAKPHGIGGDGPAGFRLPPVIDDRNLQLLLGPLHGVGIGALAGEEERLELR